MNRRDRKDRDPNFYEEHPIAGALMMLFAFGLIFIGGLVLVALFVAVH